MEELLAYTYLLAEGFPLENIYEEKLNELFLADLNNPDLLELELLSNNKKESIIYIRTHIDYHSFDYDKFGKTLMNLLKPLYQNMDIKKFANRMYSVWESLAGCLQKKEPFFILSYADDPLSYGDEKQTRELYEKMLSFYDDKKNLSDTEKKPFHYTNNCSENNYLPNGNKKQS